MSQATASPAPSPEPEVDPFAHIALTQAQKAEWDKTAALLQWTAPGFRHILYKLLNKTETGYGAVCTKSVPVAATDARNVLINPGPFFAYTLPERVFILSHEIVHNVFGDVEFMHRCKGSGTVPMDDGKTLPYRHGTMNKAMDYRINALLRDSKIGSPPKDCCLDDTIATAATSCTEAYKKVYEDEESGGKKTGPYQSFDVILAPGTSNGTTSQQRNQQAWATEIATAAALEAMKKQGHGKGALQRMFDSILNPVIPWTDHIRGIFNRKVGSGSYNWRRPDRRFIVRDIHMPSRSGNGANWVVCWGDTSGSIGPAELTRYLGELSGIIEDCKPKRLTVIWCDSSIHGVSELTDAADLVDLQQNGVGGGGGTSVKPVFDWIADSTEKPDVFIGFTDGFVTFPRQMPDYECIWASTTNHTFPWGDVVRINAK